MQKMKAWTSYTVQDSCCRSADNPVCICRMYFQRSKKIAELAFVLDFFRIVSNGFQCSKRIVSDGFKCSKVSEGQVYFLKLRKTSSTKSSLISELPPSMCPFHHQGHRFSKTFLRVHNHDLLSYNFRLFSTKSLLGNMGS